MGMEVGVRRYHEEMATVAGMGALRVEMNEVLDLPGKGQGTRRVPCSVEAREPLEMYLDVDMEDKDGQEASLVAPVIASVYRESSVVPDVRRDAQGGDSVHSAHAFPYAWKQDTACESNAYQSASAVDSKRAQELVPIASPDCSEVPRQRRHWLSEMKAALFANRLLVLVATLLLIEPLFVVVAFKSLSVEQLQQGVAWLMSLHSLYGMGLYAAAFGFLVVLGTPSSPLTLASGFLFGTFRGVIVAMVGSAAAASASFLGSRYFGSHDAIRAWVERSFSPQRVRAFDLSIYRDAFRFVFFVRLSPAFPFGLSNYMFAVTSVPYVTFLFASMLGILPGTIILAVSGSLADDVFFSDSPAVTDPFWSVVRTVLIVVGLLSSVVVITIISQATEKDVEESLDELEEVA